MSSTAMYMSFVADVNLQPQITGTTFLLVSRRELYYMSLPVRLSIVCNVRVLYSAG